MYSGCGSIKSTKYFQNGKSKNSSAVQIRPRLGAGCEISHLCKQVIILLQPIKHTIRDRHDWCF